MVTPVSESTEMISQMRPERVAGRWAFRTISEQEFTALISTTPADMKAMFREGEGISVLIPAAPDEDAMVQITLQVFSDLEGVGLTAAVSATLAEANIPCNVIAATLHDHIFVPEAMADHAVTLLKARAAQEAA